MAIALITPSPTTLVHSFKSPQSPPFPEFELSPPRLPLPTQAVPSTFHHVSTRSASTPPPSPRMPPEIVLLIISFFTIPNPTSITDIYDPSNPAPICNCCLVNNFWLHAAREHLWAYVRLAGGRRGQSFIKLLQHYTSGQGSTLPSLALYVKYLSIRESRRGSTWDPKWLNPALPILAWSFPSLHSLEVEHVTWEFLSSHSRSAFVRGFKGVRKLALGGFDFRTTLDMIKLIAEFEDIEALVLDGVRCDCQWDDIPTELICSSTDNGTTLRPPTKLRELAVRGVCTKQILRWMRVMMKHDRMQVNVQVLRIGALGIKSAPEVGKFMKALGGNLKQLHIGFDGTTDEIVSSIDLSHNHCLEEMHVYGLVIPSYPPQPPQLTQLTALLDRVCAPLRALSLVLYPSDLHGAMWRVCKYW